MREAGREEVETEAPPTADAEMKEEAEMKEYHPVVLDQPMDAERKEEREGHPAVLGKPMATAKQPEK